MQRAPQGSRDRALTTRLDISIGPVQGFVVQSRRTRDLWGSSYLLSFLSAHALHGACQAGGKVIQPSVESDELYQWVSGSGQGRPPSIGTIPNHFAVRVDGDAKVVANAAVQHFDAAWMRVCDAVWHSVESACALGNGTAEIWQRQVDTFWEVVWTAGPVGDHGRLLARRKQWRTHRPTDEPGDKCTVMHDYQELSGYVRARTSARQDGFWRDLRSRIGVLDLRDNERLCAMALVKRLFPRFSEKALGWKVDASHWPSTVYVGAVPWLASVTEAVPEPAMDYAVGVLKNVSHARSEHPGFTGVDASHSGDFAYLDANFFHVNTDHWPWPDEADDDSRRQLANQLHSIYSAEAEDQRELGPPSMFYALLLADGDRLGRLLERVNVQKVSDSLATFTRAVPKIVESHQGVTIYAGGDDVLAMLPLPGALACAEELSNAYRNAFRQTAAEDEATLSAATVFAHIRLPMRTVLQEARHLLDDVAKDGNGRDSLAVGVLKRSGLHCQWVTTWRRPSGTKTSAVELLEGLIRELTGETDSRQADLSSSVIYRLRETLGALCGWDRWQPGHWDAVPSGLDLQPFVRAEIRHSLEVGKKDDASGRADKLADKVYTLLHSSRNSVAKVAIDNQAGVDALLLARFLTDPIEREAN